MNYKSACLDTLELVAILLYILGRKEPGYLVTPFSLPQVLLIMLFPLIHDLLICLLSSSKRDRGQLADHLSSLPIIILRNVQ